MSNSQSDHVHFNLLKRDENRRQSRAGKCKIHSASESKVFLQMILVVAASVDIKLGTFSAKVNSQCHLLALCEYQPVGRTSGICSAGRCEHVYIVFTQGRAALKQQQERVSICSTSIFFIFIRHTFLWTTPGPLFLPCGKKIYEEIQWSRSLFAVRPSLPWYSIEPREVETNKRTIIVID